MSWLFLRWTGWASAVLVVLAVNTFAGERAKKKLTPAEMVAALATKNRPPKYVDHDLVNDAKVPLFPAGYDWKEYGRVRAAIFAIDRGVTPELWEELLKHVDDKRYAITLVDASPGLPDVASGRDFTVGEICGAISSACLWKLYERHSVSANDVTRPWLQIGAAAEIDDLVAWRKQRADKLLWELQLEACTSALKNVETLDRANVEQKARIRKGIQGEIDKLKSEKRPAILPNYLYEDGGVILIHGWHEASYDEKLAAELRERYSARATPSRGK